MNSPCASEQVILDVPLLEEQTVGRVAFVVAPDEFDRVEFGRVTWEPLGVEARMILTELGKQRPLVNAPLVPQQNDRAVEMMQQLVNEVGDVAGVKVLFLEANIQAHSFPTCGNRQGGQSGNAIVLVAVADDRHMASRPPCPAAGRNEQESALIEEDQVGTKFLVLFFICGHL